MIIISLERLAITNTALHTFSSIFLPQPPQRYSLCKDN